MSAPLTTDSANVIDLLSFKHGRIKLEADAAKRRSASLRRPNFARAMVRASHLRKQTGDPRWQRCMDTLCANYSKWQRVYGERLA